MSIGMSTEVMPIPIEMTNQIAVTRISIKIARKKEMSRNGLPFQDLPDIDLCRTGRHTPAAARAGIDACYLREKIKFLLKPVPEPHPKFRPRVCPAPYARIILEHAGIPHPEACHPLLVFLIVEEKTMTSRTDSVAGTAFHAGLSLVCPDI